MLSIYIDPVDLRSATAPCCARRRRFVDWVKASPPATPVSPVLAPGDVERATRRERLSNGVPLDETTWSDLLAAGRSVGIDADGVLSR